MCSIRSRGIATLIFFVIVVQVEAFKASFYLFEVLSLAKVDDEVSVIS